MQAVILAGGLGTRLRSKVSDVPKPMAPIGNTPFLEYLVKMLKCKGIFRFVFCTGYMAEKIKDYFGSGDRFGVEIKYSHEIAPLYSAGALKQAEDLLENDFFVVNGDVYLDIDYKKVFEYHVEKNAYITIPAIDKSEMIAGICHTFLFEHDKVMEYYGRNNTGNAAVAGVFVLNKKILSRVVKGMPASLENDLIDNIAKQGKAFSIMTKGYFIDIGIPETYEKFILDVKNGKVQ